MNLEIQLLFITFLVAVVLGLIIIPILKKMKIGQIERDDGPASHLKKQGTPTMGGIIIMLAIAIVTIGTYIYLVATENKELGNDLIHFLLITLGFGLVGFIDDFKKLVLKNTDGLSPRKKMLGLLIIATIYVLFIVYVAKIGTDTYIPIAKIYINIPTIIYIPLAILVILATTNAINLTDGIDGLASSVSSIIITCLTVIGMSNVIFEVSFFGSIVIGATLGFLLFNTHPAKVFMGDTGSLMLGGVISALALYLKMPLLLLLIAIIPVIETLSVIIQVVHFKRTGKRVFKMTPIHHHFELSGWRENKIVVVFTLVTLIACTIGLQII